MCPSNSIDAMMGAISQARTINEVNGVFIGLEKIITPLERDELIAAIERSATLGHRWLEKRLVGSGLLETTMKRTGAYSQPAIEQLVWARRFRKRRSYQPGVDPAPFTRVEHTPGYSLFWKGEGRSKTLLVGWTGRPQLLMLPTPDLLQGLRGFDLDVLLIRSAPGGYREGVLGLGGNLEEATQSLRSMASKWGYEKFWVVGVSSGALASLPSAIQLQAEGIYLLGPGNPLSENAPVSPKRIESDYSASRQTKPGVGVVCFATGVPRDVESAVGLVNLTSFELRPIDVDTHGILYPLLVQGRLQTSLEGSIFPEMVQQDPLVR